MDKVQYSLVLTSNKWNCKQGPQRTFILPVALAASDVANSHGSVSDDLRQAFQHRICRSAWLNLHNIGRRRAKTIRCCAREMQMPKRSQLGNTNRSTPVLEAKDIIRQKRTWAEKNLACPFAANIVQDIYGHVTLRNNSEKDEGGLVYLPP